MATIDEFRALLNSMPAAERQAFLNSLVADYAGEEVNLGSRSEQADYLRRAPGPGMRRAGRLAVAASPLEHAAHMGMAGLGEFDARRVRQERQEAGERKQRALSKLLRVMSGTPRSASPATPWVTGPGVM